MACRGECSSGPDKLVGWPLLLKTGTVAVFPYTLCLKNKTERQSHTTLGYLFVWYNFAPKPSFNKQLIDKTLLAATLKICLDESDKMIRINFYNFSFTDQFLFNLITGQNGSKYANNIIFITVIHLDSFWNLQTGAKSKLFSCAKTVILKYGQC